MREIRTCANFTHESPGLLETVSDHVFTQEAPTERPQAWRVGTVGNGNARATASRISLTAAAVIVVVALVADSDRLFEAGLFLSMLSATGLLASRSIVTDAIIERARQDGYDAGYEDGCQVTRPAKVKLLPGSGFPRGGPPHQLREESDLGRVAERIDSLGGV